MSFTSGLGCQVGGVPAGSRCAFACSRGQTRSPICTCSAPAEAGSYLRLIDSCVTHLKAQGPSRTCNESKEEEEVQHLPHGGVRPFHQKSTCLTQLTLATHVVQIWSRNPRISDATNPSNSTEWWGVAQLGELQTFRSPGYLWVT